MASLPNTLSSRRGLALAAVAGVGIIGTTLQLLSGNGLNDSNNPVHRLRSLSTALYSRRPQINLAAPYAPHADIDIESVDPAHRRLATFWTKPNGTVFCRIRQTRGPDDIPADIEFENTIVVGYPGADKRIVLRQMELMTRLSGRDAWDFEFLGMTRQPFIKTNYPHHEGIWGWQDHADQVMLVVRNIRHTIDEYHDILSDIDYAKTWREATDKIPRLYSGELLEESYVRWRDERTMDEIGWYGWLIDYWMEGGVLRDYFDHKLTTKEHWAKLRAPETFTYGELQWDVNNCETEPLLNATYDDNCLNTTTADCRAKLVISAERLMDPATGAAEIYKVGALLNETAGVNETLIGEGGWECLYNLTIANNPNGTSPDGTEGFNDYRVREGVDERKHVVSTRHLNKMIQQLTRLIDKYSAYDPETDTDWETTEQSIFLVEILTEHRELIRAELNETSPEQVWAHPPKPNWVVFPMCGEATEGRRVWDYNYPHEYSGTVLEMFPDVV